jgi:hypothetical protein
MKSHDYHIWIEWLLPSMVRGYVPEHVWKVLAELSFLFCQLCAKEISLKVVEELEKTAPELLCKLEKIFPPAFFLSMQHPGGSGLATASSTRALLLLSIASEQLARALACP